MSGDGQAGEELADGRIEPALFRQVMASFATGVTVVTTAQAGEIHGMTANAFMSGSLEPPLCVVSVAKRARMHGHLLASRRFGISFLSEGQEQLSNHFAGRPVPGLRPEFATLGEAPVLAKAAGWLAADLHATPDCGDHTLFIGRIRQLRASHLRPLLYVAGHYASLGRGQPRATEEPPEFW